jgi:hypothetical protein
MLLLVVFVGAGIVLVEVPLVLLEPLLDDGLGGSVQWLLVVELLPLRLPIGGVM